MNKSPFNTYQHMQALVSQGFATVKTDGIFDTFKYSRKVMYENLWNKIPGILECRGHVYDNTTGALVQAAPTKSFNYLENGHWQDVSLATRVVMFKKYNGFMAAATIYNDQQVISSTGTTSSDFVKLAKKHIDKHCFGGLLDKQSTVLFEILDESDPHIVDEGFASAVALGWRYKDLGDWYPQGMTTACTLSEALQIASKDRGEGFMVYEMNKLATGEVCKIKTPYYIGKKILMRMTPKNVHALYSGNCPVRLPEMWYTTALAVQKRFTEEQWVAMDAQTRRVYLEEIYEQDVASAREVC